MTKNTPKKTRTCPHCSAKLTGSRSLWNHVSRMHPKEYGEKKAKKKAQGPIPIEDRRKKHLAKKKEAKAKEIQALVEAHSDKVCCGVKAPKSLSAWRRHKKKFKDCERAPRDIKALVDESREARRDLIVVGASYLAGEDGPPATDSADGLVMRMEAGLRNRDAHRILY